MPADARRRPWVVSGLALIAAALTGAAATYLWWLPCQGRMLVGTPYGPRFSDDLLGAACIDRMDEGTPFPLPTEAALSTPGLLQLSTLTVVLVAVAWLVPAAFLRVDPTARTGIALPGWALLVVAGLGIATALGGSAIGLLASISLDTLVAVGLVVLVTNRPPGLVRWVVMAPSLLAFGLTGLFADYSLMVRWSEANWDSPPGSGYLPSALFLVSGIVVLVITALGRPEQPASARALLKEVHP